MMFRARVTVKVVRVWSTERGADAIKEDLRGVNEELIRDQSDVVYRSS
jgi:hypothetical protein